MEAVIEEKSLQNVEGVKEVLKLFVMRKMNNSIGSWMKDS